MFAHFTTRTTVFGQLLGGYYTILGPLFSFFLTSGSNDRVEGGNGRRKVEGGGGKSED